MKKLITPIILSLLFFISISLYSFVGSGEPTYTPGRQNAIYTPADQDTLQYQISVLYREIDAIESLPQGKAKYLKSILENASIKLAQKGTDTTTKK